MERTKTMLNKTIALISLAASLWVGIVPASYASTKHYHGARAAAGVTLHMVRETAAAGAAFGYQPQDLLQEPEMLPWIDNPGNPRG